MSSALSRTGILLVFANEALHGVFNPVSDFRRCRGLEGSCQPKESAGWGDTQLLEGVGGLRTSPLEHQVPKCALKAVITPLFEDGFDFSMFLGAEFHLYVFDRESHGIG